MLVLIGVALLAASCGHSHAVHPKPSAVIVLQYAPAYHLLGRPHPVPAAQTRRMVCFSPLTPLCTAAVHVAKHGTGDRQCAGIGTAPPELVVYGSVHGRPRYADLKGCTRGFPVLMQHAVSHLLDSFPAFRRGPG